VFRFSRILLIGLAALLVSLGAAQAQTIHYVDCDNGSDVTGDGSPGNPLATINEAFLTWANDGDEIRVLPSTCRECVDATQFASGGVERDVDIVAQDFLDNQDNTTTIIDGDLDNNGSADCVFPFSVVNLGGTGLLFQGFTVTGGASSGIYGRGTVSITNNLVEGNSSTFGGGIYVYTAACYYGSANAVVADNTVRNNDARHDPSPSVGFGGDGGGVYIYAIGIDNPSCVQTQANATVNVTGNSITNNTVQGNTAGSNVAHGGGLVVLTDSGSTASSATVTVTQNQITDNFGIPGSLTFGGGAYVAAYGYGTESILVGGSTTNADTIANNTATGDGGGISAWSNSLSSADHQVTVANNTVTGNTAAGAGGGIDAFLLAQDLLPTQSVVIDVTDNVVTGNTANGGGGGGGGMLGTSIVERSDGALSTIELNITGNRVTNNNAVFMGGGIGLYVLSDADPDLDGIVVEKTDGIVRLDNNLIGANVASGNGTSPGGGVFVYTASYGEATSTVNFTRNTIAANSSDVGAGGVEVEQTSGFDGMGVDEGLNFLTFNSDIIAGSVGSGYDGPGLNQPGQITTGGLWNLLSNIDYVNFHDNTGGDVMLANGVTETNSTLTDPMLDPVLGIPSICSPTIDAGNPALDFASETQPNAGRSNRGHTGGTLIAIQSLADVNGDGIVDGVDVVKLSTSFSASQGQPRFLQTADLDGNLLVDGLDLGYVGAQFGDVCP